MSPFTPLDAVPDAGALFGLDLGTRTIGIAMSDAGQRIATPLHTIRRTRFRDDAADLLARADTYEVVAFVLGLPLNMDGSSGPRAQSTRDFARNLARLTDRPIAAWDERWSTVAAERSLIEADTSRRRRRELVDRTAATLILQGALDRLRAIRQ